ncbi:MAG: hypothetical protein GFH27_549293n94 [Chloroflexi bacterium AL-W]|nr:hypothetical protein [Chloroflexi bacterium AL-N1]NOK67791.1 hypothetical protein [Chloroflexi bacterium AL-N10]NOK75439.1 hypothetical protein [Chloroflexi bacterium AL-N5]NOK82227.1 hypothetical protein [Chloroflexi bacterium AL-W]NOK90072.1 hypothetical protein [Chloroflexi bacterium AL-N15]
MAVQASEIVGNNPNNASGGAVLGSVHQIESLARARGDVLLHETHLSNDDLVQTANELAQLAGYLAQISTARSEFLSKVAHELRTPLTVAKGWISMLRYGELLPDQERVIEVVDQQVDELTRLVGDLLDLSRREADTLVLQLEMVDLVDLVEQVVEHRRELTSLKGIQLVVRASQNEEIYACIDRGRIAQVLNNLIDNACRYVEHYCNGRIELGINVTETAAHISIRDNGIGVPPEHLPRIFEPFYQVKGQKRGKCGLGLAITHELVSAHGGSVTVESKLGHGTCFHIWLRKMDPSDADIHAQEANL